MKPAALARISWAIGSVFLLESVLVSLSLGPALLFWEWKLGLGSGPPWAQAFLSGLTFIAAYLLFIVPLMVLTPLASRLLGWRTPANLEMPIQDYGWPLLNWVRFTITTYVIRLLAGPVFRSSPVWTLYMRLNGAQLGRGVLVNSLGVMDHNLLEFGDHTVIGGDVHLSGHTVEHGMVKTAPVRLGRDVTVGVGAVVEIGVEAGAGCHIGALALVPKFSKLEAGGVYGGVPAHRIDR